MGWSEYDETVEQEIRARIDAGKEDVLTDCLAVFREAARSIAVANYATGKIPHAQISIWEDMAVREFEELVRKRIAERPRY